ncbi:MAG: DUF4854 domain-containing protein [Lachnospiraceae bacterium]|nr:DUF4854 domain-containing protein [Lachnospiraceae bacterium]
MKRTLIKVLAVALALVSLSACGARTIESIMSTKAAQTQLETAKEQIMSAYSDYYSDYDIEFSGNDIVYKYYYSSEFDEDTLSMVAATLESDDSWSSTIASTKSEMAKTTGITPTSITYVYYDANGNELFKVTE